MDARGSCRCGYRSDDLVLLSRKIGLPPNQRESDASRGKLKKIRVKSGQKPKPCRGFGARDALDDGSIVLHHIASLALRPRYRSDAAAPNLPA
jgi:hypothetical protein